MRYAILAGDYETARTLSLRAGSFGTLTPELEPVFQEPPIWPQSPDITHPENYYAYRFDVIDRNLVERFRGELPGLPVATFVREGYPSRNPPITEAMIDGSLWGNATRQATAMLRALQQWERGNQHFERREYKAAVDCYKLSQDAAVTYLEVGVSPSGSVQDRLNRAMHLIRTREADLFAPVWNQLRWRRGLLSLTELNAFDRARLAGEDGALVNLSRLLATFFYEFSDINDPAGLQRAARVDPLMIVLANVWIPLAKAEAYQQKRQYDLAFTAIGDLLKQDQYLAPRFRLLCDFIELPFLRLLQAEILMAKANSLYKMRLHEDARATYTNALTLFDQNTAYSNRVRNATEELKTGLVNQLQPYSGPPIGAARKKEINAIQSNLVELCSRRKKTLQTFGLDLTLPDRNGAQFQRVTRLVFGNQPFAGLPRQTDPHQPVFTFAPVAGQPVVADTNPRVYAILLIAQAKLLQLEAGLNFLGYREDFVPPWRFQFLLERARYFAEHAKNAQRDYLNFLNNAENEEMRELGATQLVEQEKSNVRIEAIRIEQANITTQSAQASFELSELTERQTQIRIENYQTFDRMVGEAEAEQSFFNAIGDLVGIGTGIATGNPQGVIGGALGFIRAGMNGGKNEIEELRRMSMRCKTSHICEIEQSTLSFGFAWQIRFRK